MKRQRKLQAIKDNVFSLFIEGDQDEQILAKKLGKIINEFENWTIDKDNKPRFGKSV